MAAFQSRSYFVCGLVLLHLLTTVCAKKQYNNYDTYDVQTDCTLLQTNGYRLLSSGIGSAVKLKVPSTLLSYFHDVCQLTISSFNDDNIVLVFEDLLLSPILGRKCVNFLEIKRFIFANYAITENLCDYVDITTTWNIYSEREIILNFLTNGPSAVIGDEFTIVATAYNNQDCFSSETMFRCDNGRCIWKGFTCDGVNNCGDNSDENDFGRSQCALPDEYDYNVETQTLWGDHRAAIIGVSVPFVIIAVICTLLRICLACRRTERAATGGTTTIRRRIYNIPGGRDPPYTILSNEPGSVPFDPPPPYSTVAISPKDNPHLTQQGTSTQQAISTQPEISVQSGMQSQSGTSVQHGGATQQGIPPQQLTNAESGNIRF